MRGYLMRNPGTATQVFEYITHQRDYFLHRNSHPHIVHVEFATYFGGALHRPNLTAVQENMNSDLIDNSKTV